MLWKHEGKQLLRTPLRTAAFCLALAVVIGLLCITLGLQTATARAVTEVEEQYTTIAVLKSGRTLIMRNPFYMDMFVHKKLTLTNLQSVERHSSLLAHNASVKTVTSADFPDGTVGKLDQPNNLSLFAVTCTGQGFQRNDTMHLPSGSKKAVKIYDYQFRVEEVGHLHGDMPTPQTLSLTSNLNLSGGLPIFEEGKRYWVCGYYEPNSDTHGVLTLCDERYMQTDLWETSDVIYMPCPRYGEQYLYRIAMIGKYGGALSAISDTEVRAMWEKTRECLEISTHSLLIRSADNVSSLLQFASGEVKMLQGTGFSEEDISKENKVAIVSEVLAEKNGWQVGDTVELHFYGSNFYFPWTFTEGKQPYPDSIYGDSKMHHIELFSEPKMSASMADGSYTVVGIYSCENGIVEDYHGMHPNTVIVPQSVLPNTFSTSVDAIDYTLLLPNGSIDAFEEELISYGHGEIMEYYDGGYSVIMPNVRSIRDSAAFVNSVVLGLWAVVILAVLVFFVMMLLPAGRIKYSLGVGRGAIFGHMTFSTLLMILVSGTVGCAGSVLLYGRALRWMMQTEFTSFNTAFSTASAHTEMLEQLLTMLDREPRFFLIAAVVQMGILALLGTVLCAIVSLRKTGFRQ